MIIEVVDSSAFVEIEKSQLSPSLFTKVFLEKEIYANEDNDFKNSHKYIDYLFRAKHNNDRAKIEKAEGYLELLLGN